MPADFFQSSDLFVDADSAAIRSEKRANQFSSQVLQVGFESQEFPIVLFENAFILHGLGADIAK